MLTKENVELFLKNILEQLTKGCGNHGCCIHDPRIGTNGTCKCLPKEIARDLIHLGNEIKSSHEWPKT